MLMKRRWCKSYLCASLFTLTIRLPFINHTGVFTAQDNGKLEETCQLETMEARCRWNSEVILMTSARWGRMKTGRCLEIHSNALAALGHDPLFLGCSEDVLHVMDRKCTGRSSCDVGIPDPTLDEIKPCYSDLTRYLETSYICVKGRYFSL